MWRLSDVWRGAIGASQRQISARVEDLMRMETASASPVSSVGVTRCSRTAISRAQVVPAAASRTACRSGVPQAAVEGLDERVLRIDLPGAM